MAKNLPFDSITDKDGNPVTREWLLQKIVHLLENAAGSEEDVDHQAAAKYCDLMAKLLPTQSKSAKLSPEDLAAARQAAEA
jgi:hypothetical protein